jgi:soluble lytic murein transglycosylase-like protein
MPYQWETEGATGLIRVRRAADQDWRVPTLQGAAAEQVDAVADRWGAVAAPIAARWGIPDTWLLAMAWQESKGNPAAMAPDGGVGLMQITHPSLKSGYTTAQLQDGPTSLEVAARYIARQLVPRHGRDFPKIAAAYNAGSVRASALNEWGMVCTGSHIDGEVCAHNRILLRRMADAELERGRVLASVWATSDGLLAGLLGHREPREG